MSLATNTDLQAAIADWLNRVGAPELTARTPDFITLFESQFNKLDIRHHKALKRSTATMEDEYTALPGDFVEMQRLRVTVDGQSPQATLRYLTPEEFEDQELIRSYGNVGQFPAFYTVVGVELQIKPFTPSATTELELLYWAKLDPLATNETNWLLLEAPECYLFGALCEAIPFIRDDERLPMWTDKRDGAVGRLREAAERFRHTAGTLKPRRRKLG